MGQSFREQLAQSTALAQRVVTKISGRKEPLPLTSHAHKATSCLTVLHRCGLLLPELSHIGERAESHDDKAGHELLALR